MIRAVLDTNVIISGILKEDSVPGQLLKAFLEENKFLLVTSMEILREIALVLRYPKIQKIHGWSEERIETFLLRFLEVSLLTKDEIKVEVIKDDPEDNKFLSCALEGEADYIVTGDIHLKQLKEYKGVKILTPRFFLEEINIDR